MGEPSQGTGVRFRDQLTVPESAIDDNDHVNNVVYIQWMQDVAIRHSDASGGTAAARAMGCTWVVRSHAIEYLSPAFAGDELEVVTWVESVRRVRSLRKYEFSRPADGKRIARGETDWVFVDSTNGRPRAVPDSVLGCFLSSEEG